MMRYQRPIVAGLLLSLLGAGPTRAFVLANLEWNGEVQHPSWENVDHPVRFRLNDRPLTLLTNFAGNSELDPAIRAAMQAWELPQAFQFRFDGPSPAVNPGIDGTNLITLADTPVTRDTTANFWAFASNLFQLVDNRWRFKESDITFSPRKRFATDGTASRGDFQGILAHELGHALGLEHSPLLPTTMFAGGTPAGDTSGQTLSEDDLAGARALYRPSSDLGNGILAGQVLTEPGLPVLGAHVVALDSKGAARVSALTNRFGAYVISSLPPGSYRLYAEPLDGPADPENVNSNEHKNSRRDFRTAFAGGNATPTGWAVAAGRQTTVAPIKVSIEKPTLNLTSLLWSRDWKKWTQTKAAPIKPGETIYLAAYGLRMDKVATSHFRISDPEIRIDRGNIARGGPPNYNPPYAVLPLTASSAVTPGPRTLFVDTGAELVAFSGVIEVHPR